MIGTKHLGARASDLVDERLDGDERARALAHLAECQECCRLVAAERQHRRLAGQAPTPTVPTDLQLRLLALSGPGESAPWAETAPRRWPVFALATAASAAGFAVLATGTLYLAGAPRPQAPEALTAAFALETSTVAAVGLPALAAATHTDGWPADLAAPRAGLGQVVASDPLPGGVVRIAVEIDGASVTVLEQHGRLDLSQAEVSETDQVGGLEVVLVDGWWFAEVGDDVVAITGPERACLELLASFGAAGVDPVQRIGAGWHVLIGGEL